MPRARRGGAALVAVATALVLSAGIASAKSSSPKQQSVAQYAKTVCSTYQGLLNDLTTYGNGIAALDPTDPAAFTTSATTQTDALLTTVKAAEKTLTAAYPDISDGQKTGKLLATNANQLNSLLTAAEQTLTTGGASGPTEFTVAIQTLSTKLSDPFSKVTDQTLIGAFQKQKICKNIVQVVG